MLYEAGWGLVLLAGLCSCRGGRGMSSPGDFLQSQDADIPQNSVLNQIDLSGVKWPELLVSSGEGLVVSLKGARRKPWCQSQQVRLRVSGEPGCGSRLVTARFCQGQCTSLWVPRAEGGEPAWSSCPVCRPVRGGWVRPSLTCEDGRTRPAAGRIFRVKRCRCREPGTDLPPALYQRD